MKVYFLFHLAFIALYVHGSSPIPLSETALYDRIDVLREGRTESAEVLRDIKAQHKDLVEQIAEAKSAIAQAYKDVDFFFSFSFLSGEVLSQGQHNLVPAETKHLVQNDLSAAKVVSQVRKSQAEVRVYDDILRHVTKKVDQVRLLILNESVNKMKWPNQIEKKEALQEDFHDASVRATEKLAEADQARETVLAAERQQLLAWEQLKAAREAAASLELKAVKAMAHVALMSSPLPSLSKSLVSSSTAVKGPVASSVGVNDSDEDDDDAEDQAAQAEGSKKTGAAALPKAVSKAATVSKAALKPLKAALSKQENDGMISAFSTISAFEGARFRSSTKKESRDCVETSPVQSIEAFSSARLSIDKVKQDVERCGCKCGHKSEFRSGRG